ncbi:Protein OS-9 [Agyrium rufum]|nr:Protein OS-9 [Agyrium rufum]
MRKRLILLVTATAGLCSPHSFSVHDDLFAFPQYEVIFLETIVSEDVAESRLAFASSSFSAKAKPTGHVFKPPYDDQGGELSTLQGTQRPSGDGYGEKEDGDLPNTYEYMLHDTIPYLCSIPQVSQPIKNDTAAAQSRAEEARELARASDRGWELLKDMEGHCMYFPSGWWSYAFCYKQEIKQFHALPSGRGGAPSYPPIEDQTTGSYILGKFDTAPKRSQGGQIEGQQDNNADSSKSQSGSDSASNGVSELQTKGDMRYLVQKLSGGTPCDLTGKPRKIEVQFHCDPHRADRIGWIKEVATCAYLMVIYTPRLCNDVAFLPPREIKAHAIECTEIVPEGELDDWRRRKESERERKALEVLAKDSREQQTNSIVGGIEVGGQKLVGKEGLRIEPPKQPVATEGKSNIIARRASKEEGGKMYRKNDAELKRLDLDPAEVEMWRKQLEQIAEGNAWTLELVQVGNELQLRGTVEAGTAEGDYENQRTDGDKSQDQDEAADGKTNDDDSKEHAGSEEVYKEDL